MTDGMKSSEFGLTALMIVAVTVLIALDKITVYQVSQLWPLFGGTGAYAVGRSLVKGLAGGKLRAGGS